MCFHKYSKIEDDGYQYCTKCGKAIHQCRWKFIKEVKVLDFDKSNELPLYFFRLYECEICGKMKKEKI